MTAPIRHLGLGCIALAVGLALNSVLGPLITGVIDYRYTETFENQGIGLDAFALVVAVPLLIAAGVLALRGHLAAPFLALGPALMSAYMFPQYVLGAHYLDLPGNNEDFFPLHLGLFVLSVCVAVLAWLSIDSDGLPSTSRRFQFWTGALLFAVAGFLILRYVPSLIDIWRDHLPDEYVDDPIAFWLIAFMDLGIVMPAAVAGGLALWRGAQRAQKLMYAIVGWFALVGPAVAAMGFAMEVNDDPNASLGSAVAFTIYGALFALLAAYLFRPLFRRAAAGVPAPARGEARLASPAGPPSP
ncbi:MAG TPA: hypothetical protein VFB08_17580 [Burkholderiales bacterium]|nr:hypothetical protein [Burkholderiales bacterium]